MQEYINQMTTMWSTGEEPEDTPLDDRDPYPWLEEDEAEYYPQELDANNPQ